MDAAAHYRHLAQLGRDEFLAAAAPAVLVRYPADGAGPSASASTTLTIDQDDQDLETVDETMPHCKDDPSADEPTGFEVYPLTKKPGASFPDRITIGRTPNNDVVIPEHSVSRLHAYVRRDGARWLVADAGSKNGSFLERHALGARKEQPLASRAVLRLGDVDLTFYLAADLYAVLGGAA